MNAIKYLIGFFLTLNTMAAQYVLDETGLMAGGGIAPVSAPMQTGSGGNITFFWTHFNCGKSYGYHLSGGLRYVNYQVATDTIPAKVPLQDLALTIGFSGKFRMKNYHRKTELAFLFGPGLAYHLPGGLPQGFGSPDVVKTALVPEAQFAVWWKKDLSKHQTLFISLGMNLALSDVFGINGASTHAPAYVYLSAGFSWWNNK